MKKTVGSRGVLVGFLGIYLVASVSLVHFTEAIDNLPEQFNRSCFPAGFTFGTASSSYQYEGAASKDGRGPSIWDTFTHKFPEKILDGSNGDVAVDSYHRYKEDVKIMQEMGLDSYRFSISWSRILPTGKLSGGVNKEGIKYYNNLINELLSKGVQPYVTLFHWDLPQGLEDAYGGFLSPHIVDDFKDYAELCYKEFGDRVKHWITLNEPWTFSNGGYALGNFAPGRCSKYIDPNCTAGHSGTEPYLTGHYQLLSHAAAVHVYKLKYQASQKGKIGITLVSHWMVPFSNAKSDRHAALRALDFMYGWFMDPLTFGWYPLSMQSLVGDRLPKFSKEESDMVKGSFDFLGLNYYTGNYAEHVMNANNNINPSYTTDAQAKQTTDRKGVPIGLKSGSPWLHVYPQGIRSLLHYTKRKYNNPIIYITENGISEKNDPTLSLKEALKDDLRITYYHGHLYQVQRAIKEGVDVRGYFAWSLLDNFEWNAGYTVRFGINFVDYKDGLLKRYPKSSALWFKNFLKKP
ncbi:hypothetical protein MKW98_019553 [Papaver atlanticum]|uniref:Uncharacterized protein n=1 Tax=Papaver atlanticum TaxID=357466 RepID=A0AAD4SA93_9MAGN|nr:hypothetical protein MKW98_019553 [Papaver atlanticum]